MSFCREAGFAGPAPCFSVPPPGEGRLAAARAEEAACGPAGRAGGVLKSGSGRGASRGNGRAEPFPLFVSDFGGAHCREREARRCREKCL